MADINDRIAALSPAQRALLELRLKKMDTAAACAPTIPHRTNLTCAPLSSAQQRLWLIDQLEPHNPVYNRPAFLWLTGPLHLVALERSLSEIVHRHEALRTTFAAEEEQPVQLVNDPYKVTIPVVDLSHLPEGRRAGQVEQLAAQEARRPFDLARGPLLRASLVRRDRQEHLLLLTIHHIVFDGWSMTLLCEELVALYGAFSAGRPSPLPELPIQYVDFAVWQRQQLQGEALENYLSYWRQQLSDAPAVLEMPTDRPRPAVQTFQGARQLQVLPKVLSESLKALSRQEGVTLFMTLLAVFKVLLYRYTGQTDIIVGSPTAGRSRLETERLIGLFVNTLVLRTDLSGNPSFRELLGRVRKVTVGAYANQDLPFDKLVEALKPRRDLSHTPLFQVMFQLRNVPKTAGTSSDLEVAEYVFDHGVARLDLSLEVEEKAEGLFCVFEYNTDLFAAATITRMLRHLRVLLEGVVANPERRLSDLPLLTEAERHQLLVEWNDTTTDYPRDHCLHQLFEAQAEQTPDAVAVACEGAQLTYRELNRRANQLAHHLQSLGVGPEVLVGICMERSVEMVVGLLGILKAGGAYVPLDPAYPQERLAFMLEDTRTPVLVTHPHLIRQLPKHGAQMVCLDAGWEAVAREDDGHVGSGATTANLAYVIYTSGSTGSPKGVQIPHRAVVNVLCDMRQKLTVTKRDVLVAVTTLSFDIAALELFLPLIVGARVELATRAEARDGSRLAAKLAATRATLMQATPATWRLLLEADWPGDPHLRILSGGESLPRDLANALLIRGAELWNLYGPTETTIWSTAFRVESPDGPVLIGRPLGNTRVYLLDRQFRPVPVGVAGELYIGGDGVARGYHKRPELTAERFVVSPFSHEPEERLYRTGDLVRCLPDGDLEFLGRVDQQVKLRGFRIELGEIETALGRHPRVQDAVVVMRDDPLGGKQLAAYVVPTQDQSVTERELRNFLKRTLPEYMLPATFTELDALPRMPNGKVDRRALPAPDRTGPDPDHAFAAPRTPTEEVLAGIWAEVLGLSRVGAHDNFFELGGHSLRATQVVSRLRDLLHVELPLSSLFTTPTVADLAKVIEDYRDEKRNQLPLPLRPVARGGDLPLSFPQERVWFLQQFDPTNVAYNFTAIFRFTGPLQVTVLHQSLSEIIRRHEIFRTTFPAVDGRPRQLIHPPRPADLPVADLRSLPEHAREVEVQRRIQEEGRKPFDLTQLPLVRWTLLQLSAQEYVLIHIEHHLVHDGWSFNVFRRELLELYKAFAGGHSSPLPDLPCQFVDVACWQRQWLQGEVAARQLAYWRQKLAGSPVELALPTDRQRPAVQSFRGASPRIELPLPLCAALRELSRREGVSLFMTLLAAFAALLHRYSDQDDICVGSGIANRRWREMEGLLGMLVNTVVLRTELSGNPRFRELLQQVRAVTLEAYAHQDLPFDHVVRALQPDRHLSQNPLFQVMFSFHDSPLQEPELPGVTLNCVEILGNGSAKFDLNVVVIPYAERRVGQGATGDAAGITLIWEYNTDLFEATTTDRMVGHYQRLLEGIVTDPAQRLLDLPLLSEAERAQVLVGWNDTKREYPRDLCVHRLFEAQVEHAPEAVAVVYSDRSVTYGELNGRANQLAGYLRALGVGPEVRVAVCLERSPGMVVGLLGVLKAGGAYVPLDPADPAERLTFMLRDSEATVLLTQQRLVERLSGHEARVVCLDADWAVIAREPATNLAWEGTPDALAYVMYTSGSTGRPKGVEIPHRGIVRLVCNVEYVQLGPTETLLQLAPPSFDAATFELYGALLHGGRCVLFPGSVPTPRQLGVMLHRHQVSTLWLTAPLFNLLIDEAPDALSGVRQLLIGGEALSVAHVRRALALLPTARIVNGYGPTENTTFTTCYPIPRPLPPLSSIPIGRPIANTQVYILDTQLRPVPIGVPGELFIGGDGLARGYLHRAELTAEKFIPHLFCNEPGVRLYRTSDRARYLPTGDIEFLGRLDSQVKLRGFRIELGEIEAILTHHPSVREALVLLREDMPGDKRLVAYIVPNRQPAPPSSALRRSLQEHLPAYMVPAVFVVLETLPLTPNGKVDRLALPAPESSRLASEGTFVAPRTPVEEALAAIWSQVLGLERVSIYDNFFELGGHSLKAAQLMSRLRDTLQVELPLRTIFEMPTVAGLADAFLQHQLEETGPEDLVRVLAELEGLSDEDAQRVLADQSLGNSKH